MKSSVVGFQRIWNLGSKIVDRLNLVKLYSIVNFSFKFNGSHSFSLNTEAEAIASSVTKRKQPKSKGNNFSVTSQVYYNSFLNWELADDVLVRVKKPSTFTPPDSRGKQKYLVKFVKDPGW